MSVDDYSEDEKWLIVTGRRWRRTDPGLEPRVVEELKSHLGAARNAVGKRRRRVRRTTWPKPGGG